MKAILLPFLLLLIAPAWAQQTFTVTSAADPGDGTCDAAECTLREAISAANATPERDFIHFDIPGDGVHTIMLASDLPEISPRAVIDGYTQPGASPNTLAVGTDAVLLIEIDASAASNGISLVGNGESRTVLRGLVINRAQSANVQTRGFSIDIYGNYIGTDPTGTLARGETNYGVNVNHNGASDVRVGSPDPADRNVISGSARFSGIAVGGNPSLPQVTAFRIQGNYIGTDASGTVELPNAGIGVQMGHTRGGLIGGVEPGAGNVISANGQAGITLNSNPNGGNFATAITVQGNFIGTDASGSLPLGNRTHGITIGVTGGHLIGGSEAVARNVIAHNAGAGISVVGADQLVVVEGNAIRMNGGDGVEIQPFGSGPAFLQASRNTFGGNGGLAIDNVCSGDSGSDGTTVNDPGDPDEGPNRCQNTPEIESSGITGEGDLVVSYRVDTDPTNATYPLTVEFYRAESSEVFEGEAFLGTDTYTEADHAGGGTSPGTKAVNLGDAAALGLTEGDVVIATATDGAGYTSEFSTAAPAVVASEGEPGLLQDVALFGTYPNPLFGDGSVIVEVTRPQPVRLVIYDLLGREVALLYDGTLPRGRHVVPLQASHLGAGTYVLRLTGQTRRLATPFMKTR